MIQFGKLHAALLRTIALGLVVACVAGCSSAPTQGGAGDYFFDDNVITNRVKIAMLEEPVLETANINVESVNGAVRISGLARSRRVFDKAFEVACEVNGVRSVKNEIQVNSDLHDREQLARASLTPLVR
jgi:osmotically-inducible protein OsmY